MLTPVTQNEFCWADYLIALQPFDALNGRSCDEPGTTIRFYQQSGFASTFQRGWWTNEGLCWMRTNYAPGHHSVRFYWVDYTEIVDTIGCMD